MKVTLGATLFASLVSCATGVTVIETKRAADQTKAEAAAAMQAPGLTPAKRLPRPHLEDMHLHTPDEPPCVEEGTRDCEVSAAPPALLMI